MVLKKLHLTLGLCLFAFIMSCEQEDIRSANEIGIDESRLRFSSNENLQTFITEGKKKDFSLFKEKLSGFERKGFQSLLPLFDSHDETAKADYANFRQNQRTEFYELKLSKAEARGQALEDEIDMTEDDLIADPHFASLLNRNREIEVDGIIYKFTPLGVLYTAKNNYEALKSVAARDVKAIESLPVGETSVIKDNVSIYKPLYVMPDEPCDCGGGGGPPAPQPPAPDKEVVRNNLKICYWDPNIWDDIFGPAEGCTDKFESDKRVKTKAWAQNYLIFSSTGVKVESQNRFLRIWWADDIDEIELGYTMASFEFNLPAPTWPSKPYVYNYEYGDFVINQYGQYVGQPFNGPKSLFEKFPIEDGDKKILSIYLFEPLSKVIGKPNEPDIDISAKDVNSAIQSLAKSAFKTVSNYAKKTINGTSAVIVYPNAPNTKLTFLYVNWSKANTNDNKISETFDWNSAVIGFKSNGGSGSPIYDSPQSYKKYQVVCYGMGRRGNTWRGSKVVMTDTN